MNHSSLARILTFALIPLWACRVAFPQPIIYDDFDYVAFSNNRTLTAETKNNGTGWENPWEHTSEGVPGIEKVGFGASSLYFNQSPEFVFDDSSHVFSYTNRANQRDFALDLPILKYGSIYMSVLIRSSARQKQSAGGAQMRVEFWDRKGAGGNVRANVGIDGKALFVSGLFPGYIKEKGSRIENVFEDETTYLLVMKRTKEAVLASLIRADGDLASLSSEPVWQVVHTQPTGVSFRSIRLVMNGTNTGIKADELRIATTWDDVVTGIKAED